MSDNNNVQPIRRHSHVRFIDQTKQLIVEEGVEKEGAISTIIITHGADNELRIFASPKDPGATVSLLAGAIDVWAHSVLARQGENDGTRDE